MRAPIAVLALKHSAASWPTNLVVSTRGRYASKVSCEVTHGVAKGDRPDTDRIPQSKQKRRTPPVIFRRNNLMQLPEFTRSTPLRWSFLVAGIFAAFIVALLGFVYLKTERDLTMRSDRMIASQMGVFAGLPPERRLDAINEDLKQDPGRVQLAGLFGSNGRRIAGNLEGLPPDLKTDNAVQGAVVDRIDERGREKQAVRLIARSLSNGDVLVIGRNVDEVGEIARVVGRALALGLVPTVFLCLGFGVALSAGAGTRIAEVNKRVQRIVAGDLHERLPYQKTDDPFSTLAVIVNGMLD